MRSKLIFAFIFLMILGAVYLVFFKKSNFEYFAADCAIYTRDGEQLFKPNSGITCAHHSDGSVLEANPMVGTLTFYDKDNKVVWTSAENVHHMINFSSDMKHFLVMTSEIINLKNKKVRSDCFSIRDLLNKKIHEWCVGDHLKQLAEVGLDYTKLWTIGVNSHYKNENVEFEISHANSFYQVPQKNSYLLHLYSSDGALIVLDENLEKIIWSKKINQFVFDEKKYTVHLHDTQFTPQGSLLTYFSRIEDSEGKLHSRLVELDAHTGNIIWQYRREPLESFYSPISVSVSVLSDGNILFNDNGWGYEITRSAKTVWTFKNPSQNSDGYPFNMLSLKPFYNLSFLKSRDLID